MQGLCDYIRVILLRILPKNRLSRWVGRLAEIRFPSWLLNSFIKVFIKAYRIPMQEVAAESFHTFNEFFVRPLRPECRPVNSEHNSLVSPVDGIVANWGTMNENTLLQAKGISYSLQNFVINPDYSLMFAGGDYITLYLSPRHYHRIHTPVDGYIEELYYIPGQLYPVNQFSVNHIPGVFTLNERLITILYNADLGHVAIVKVGATIVGKIAVIYDTVTSNQLRSPVHRHYQDLFIEKGKELGRFLMGSTVILLLEKGKVAFTRLTSGQEIRWGELIASKK